MVEFWLARKAMRKGRDKIREHYGVEEETPTSMFDLMTPAGARWLHRPDDTWHRWSYLGEAWEKADEPPSTLPFEAREIPQAPVQWIADAEGNWTRYDGEDAPR